MYRILLFIVIILFLFRMIWIYRSDKWDIFRLKNILNREIGQLYKRLMMSEDKSDTFKHLRYFFISVLAISFLTLAFTGILPIVFFGEHMNGLFLIIHVTVAPVFALSLMFTAIFVAHFKQFDNSDYIYLKELRNKKDINNRDIISRNFWSKIYYWIYLIFSVPAILTIILSMFPYLGTEGQIIMLNIHRYSTLVLVIITLCLIDLKVKPTLKSQDKD